jgi:hypothetical protein
MCSVQRSRTRSTDIGPIGPWLVTGSTDVRLENAMCVNRSTRSKPT